MTRFDLSPKMEAIPKTRYPAALKFFICGLATFVLGIISPLIAERFNQNLTSQVEVEYTYKEGAAYWVHQDISPMVGLTYRGKKVDTLNMAEFFVHNRSQKALENVIIKVDFGDNAPRPIRHMLIYNPDYDKAWLSWEDEGDQANTTISVKSLNITDAQNCNVGMRFFFDRGFNPNPRLKTPNAGVVFVPLRREEPPKASPLFGWDRYIYAAALALVGVSILLVIATAWREWKSRVFRRIFCKTLMEYNLKQTQPFSDETMQDIITVGVTTNLYVLRRWWLSESSDRSIDISRHNPK